MACALYYTHAIHLCIRFCHGLERVWVGVREQGVNSHGGAPASQTGEQRRQLQCLCPAHRCSIHPHSKSTGPSERNSCLYIGVVNAQVNIIYISPKLAVIMPRFMPTTFSTMIMSGRLDLIDITHAIYGATLLSLNPSRLPLGLHGGHGNVLTSIEMRCCLLAGVSRAFGD